MAQLMLQITTMFGNSVALKMCELFYFSFPFVFQCLDQNCL